MKCPVFPSLRNAKRVEAAGDAERGVKAGVELAVELIDQLKAWAGGVYIMPQFSKFDMVAEIIEAIHNKYPITAKDERVVKSATKSFLFSFQGILCSLQLTSVTRTSL